MNHTCRFLLLLFIFSCNTENKKGKTTQVPAGGENSTREQVSSATLAEESGNNIVAEKDEFEVMNQETIGDYYIDMPASVIIEKEGEPDEKTPFEKWESDGMERSHWNYNGLGMNLNVYKDDDGELRVDSYFIYGPCPYSTIRGIKLGSSRAEVEKQYGEVISESTEEEIIAGSIYGGIKFHIADGNVSSIFLGAMAE